MIGATATGRRKVVETANGTTISDTTSTINASRSPGNASSGPYDLFRLVAAISGGMPVVNLVRNTILNGIVNGSPGTLPTNWVNVLRGLTQTISHGTDATTGLPYIDWQLSGTPTAGNILLVFDGTNTIPASPSTQYTYAMTLGVHAGSLTGISVIGTNVDAYDATNTYITTVGGNKTVTGTLTRFSTTVTTPAPGAQTTAFMSPYIALVPTTPAVAIAVTFRIFGIQLESGAAASPYQPSPITNFGVSRNGVTDNTTPASTSLIYSGHTTYRCDNINYWNWTGAAWVYFGTTPPDAIIITGISVNPTTFTTGSSGTTVGTITITVSQGVWAGTITVGGTDAASYQVVGLTLETLGIVSAGTDSITLTATPTSGSPFTSAPITLTAQSGIANIAYSTGANPGTNPTNNGFPSPLPISSVNVAGQANSPMGWPVDIFDDFNGTFARFHSSTWYTPNSQTNNAFTTGATYLGNPIQYGCWQNNTGWGGEDNSQFNDVNNFSMSNSNLICSMTNVGGVIHTCSWMVTYPSCWGYFEASMKCPPGPNGAINQELLGFWLSGPSWPTAGEFDIQESFNAGIACTIHMGTSVNSDNRQARLTTSSTLPNSAHWYDGNYHVYGGLVTPSYVALYVDGTLLNWSNQATWLSNLSTTLDPPRASAAGSFGWQMPYSPGTPSSLSFNGTSWNIIGGINLGAIGNMGGAGAAAWTSAQFPMQCFTDWWRHSKLTPASGGPHA